MRTAVVARHPLHACSLPRTHPPRQSNAGHELKLVADVKTLPHAVSRVLACCQSLLQVGGWGGLVSCSGQQGGVIMEGVFGPMSAVAA